MILPDTSSWIEFDRATGSAVHHRMRDLIDEGRPLVVTEPVWMEVLAGAHTAERQDALDRLLGRFTLIPFETPSDFEAAIRIYRRCRGVGITPRGLTDCLIASVAQRSAAVLLSNDADLARVASVIGLELDPASLRAN